MGLKILKNNPPLHVVLIGYLELVITWLVYPCSCKVPLQQRIFQWFQYEANNFRSVSYIHVLHCQNAIDDIQAKEARECGLGTLGISGSI
jgi:hypothetical protein